MHRVIDYTPYSYQLLFHQDTSRWRIVTGGRRVGKSKMCIQECIRICLTASKQLVYWIAPSYKVAREVGWEEFSTQIEVLSPVIKNINNSTMTIIFCNGSKLVFKSGDSPDSLRGRKIHFAVLDEAAFIKPEIWQVIRPALADTKGKAVLISTPNGIGDWFHTIWLEGKLWSKYHWPSQLNELVMTPDEIEDIRSSMSQTEYDQEILAKFVTKSGRVYNDFDESNVLHEFTLDKSRHDIYLGMDFGFAGFTAVVFMAVDRLTNDRVTMFDEIYVSRTQMDDIITLILDKLKVYNISIQDVRACYTDPAGNSEELSSGLSPVDMLRKKGFNVVNKATRIIPGIAQVRAFIKSANGTRRFFVKDICKNGIRSLTGYQYDESRSGGAKEEALKDGLHDHENDAIRYFFVNCFDTAKYVAKDVEQVSPNSNITKVWKRCSKCKGLFMSTTPANKPPFICSKCKD